MGSTLEDFVASLKTKVPFFEPDWVEAKNEESDSPDSLVVFVVAKLDTNSSAQHYPLAVVRREGGLMSPDSIQGQDVLAPLQRIIAIFSDPANHVAIQSELSLAAQFYQDTNNMPAQVELSNTPSGARRSMPAASECEDQPREFPFIARCLKLGMAVDHDRGVVLPVLPGFAPLGTVFRHANMEFAMAVVDILEPTAVRYGIVAFRTTVMIHISRHQLDPDEDGYTGDWAGRRELKLEENQQRTPLSAAEYMAKFGYEPCDELVDTLGAVPLIHPSALDRVWPLDTHTGW